MLMLQPRPAGQCGEAPAREQRAARSHRWVWRQLGRLKAPGASHGGWWHRVGCMEHAGGALWPLRGAWSLAALGDELHAVSIAVVLLIPARCRTAHHPRPQHTHLRAAGAISFSSSLLLLPLRQRRAAASACCWCCALASCRQAPPASSRVHSLSLSTHGMVVTCGAGDICCAPTPQHTHQRSCAAHPSWCERRRAALHCYHSPPRQLLLLLLRACPLGSS
jgi:hypothetical protein